MWLKPNLGDQRGCHGAADHRCQQNRILNLIMMRFVRPNKAEIDPKVSPVDIINVV